jgi:hypothetical protein
LSWQAIAADRPGAVNRQGAVKSLIDELARSSIPRGTVTCGLRAAEH